MLASNPIED